MKVGGRGQSGPLWRRGPSFMGGGHVSHITGLFGVILKWLPSC